MDNQTIENSFTPLHSSAKEISGSVRNFLRFHNLEQYEENFKKRGYSTLATLKLCSQKDIEECEIPSGHAEVLFYDLKTATSTFGNNGLSTFESTKKSTITKNASDENMENGDENTSRGNWSNQIEFLLSCLGYAVGLGNVWRFPILCYRHGGAAFLIPYFTMLLIAGVPLFFLEVVLGQFAGEGPTTVWSVLPLFKGLGAAMVVVSGIVSIYYNMIIAWAFFYLIKSFTEDLPWLGCDNAWNTPSCGPPANWTGGENITFNWTLPTQEYFYNKVLQRTDSIDDTGDIRGLLLLSLGLIWLLVFGSLARGVKSSGKVVYFTATFPYVLITVLVVRGLLLPGSKLGVDFYLLKPDLNKLTDAQVWSDAASQIFYSVGPAWGGLLTFASYNKFHHNCLRDAIIVPVANCLTSFYAGFAVFPVLGHLAHTFNVDIKDVVDEGPGLVFIVYPQAVSYLPAPSVWAILFFFMLVLLGMDSQFGLVETVISSLIDEFPHHLRKRRTTVAFICCLIMFLLGFPCVTQAGFYWVNLMNNYSAWISLLLIGVLESVVIAWIYGFWNFWKDIHMMLGSHAYFMPLKVYYTLCWCLLTPGAIMFVIIYGLLNYEPTGYWDETLGWLMTAAALIMIPIFMVGGFIYSIYQGRTLSETIKYLVRPTADWGPALDKYRTGRYSPRDVTPGTPLKQII